jgi:hypothetical protein
MPILPVIPSWPGHWLSPFAAELGGFGSFDQKRFYFARTISKSAIAHPDYGQIGQAPRGVVPDPIPANPQPFGNFVRGQKLLNHLI